jgi:DNA-directed RNA polymerase specialized sigma24 family protein
VVRFEASSSQDNLPLAGFSNSQLVQRAIEDQRLHYRKALLFVKWRKCRIRRFAEILATLTENVMSHLPRARKYVRESLLSASRLCGLDSSQ